MHSSRGFDQLHGSYSSLRAVTQSDYPWLFELFTAPENLSRWRLRGAIPSPENFVHFLWDAVLAQMVIEDQSGKPVGLATCYQANFANRYAYVALISRAEVHGEGSSIEGAGLFIDYLFTNWEFRKLYCEALESNYEQFSSGAGRVFEVEARLKDHEYVAGGYEDFLVVAITRERWKKYAVLLRRMQPPTSTGRVV